MKLFALYGGYGLWVVRAQDEAEARRVALSGPEFDDGISPLGSFGDYTVDDFEVIELSSDGPAGIFAAYFS